MTSQNKKVNDTNKDYISIFQLKAFKNTNTAKITAKGIVDKGSNFADERIDIGTKEIMNNGEKAYKIDDKIYALFYKSNISDIYLITNKKLPVMYGSIMYERPFTTGFLFNIYVNFKITSDTSKIKSVNELLDNVFDGEYEIEIEINEKRKEYLPVDKFMGYDEMVKEIINVMELPEMKDIILSELKIRDEERIKRLGNTISEYTIPKPTYIFKDLVEQYNKDGKIDLEKN